MFTFWISRKLRLNGAQGSANATGVFIAVTGVALALVIMEFTLAIVTGFKHEITSRILGFDGQVWVMPEYDVERGEQVAYFDTDSLLMQTVAEAVPGSSVDRRFTQPGLLKTDNDFAGVYLVGYDSCHDYSFERGFVKEGSLPDFTDPDNSDKIAVSVSTANSLGLNVGDRINTCFFVNDAVKGRRFEIAAIYETGFLDYDRTVVFAPVSTLRRIAGADSAAITQLTLRDVAADDIVPAAERLQQRLLDAYQHEDYGRLFPVDNVKHTGGIYFNWLDLLDTNVVVIFILMLCVAGFTLVSSMFIIILERINTIGILRALGATRRQIRAIFVNMSMRIVGIGMLSGNVVGISLLLVQQRWRVVPLDEDMYYLSFVPVEINPLHFVMLNIGVLVITWLVLIVPSRVASGISPAVTMRFE